jgi:hypothetical protein
MDVDNRYDYIQFILSLIQLFYICQNVITNHVELLVIIFNHLIIVFL